MHVLVLFYPWFNFNFPLFFFMLIYNHEPFENCAIKIAYYYYHYYYQTKENQN